MKKSLIAASAASLTVAAMPVVGVFALDPVNPVKDTIQVTVNATCTFKNELNVTPAEVSGEAGTTSDGTTDTAGNTYSASGTIGEIVSPQYSSSDTHSFTTFCNDNEGYTVSATATALSWVSGDSGSTDSGDTFDYTNATLDNSSTGATGVSGKWHATIATNDSAASGQNPVMTIAQVAEGGGATDVVRMEDASDTDGETWSAQYKAYIGTETATGTYQGTITYTLSQL